MKMHVAAVLVLLFGCSGQEANTQPPLAIQLPQHKGPLPPSSSSSFSIGTLVFRDGCLLLDAGQSGEALIVWPEGVRFDEGNGKATLTYTPDPGPPEAEFAENSGGAVTVEVGQRFGVLGSKADASSVDPAILTHALPTECGQQVLLAKSITQGR